MGKAALTICAFVAVSFGVQGASHFVINTHHFAAIVFMRDEPVLLMGLAAMIVQALIFSTVMLCLWPNGTTIKQGLVVSASFGFFLASYIVLAEPAKYAAPSISGWMVVEGIASTVQFGVFGVLLGLIHRAKAVN